MREPASTDSETHMAEAGTTAHAIRLDAVRLTLASAAGPVNILNGVSLSTAPGEAIALLGPSGSGKSSLLMVAAGLEAATSGDVVIAGRKLNGLDEDALARFRREHVGIVFQSFHLIPTMTALENIAVPLELQGFSDAFERARVGLHAVGLEEREHHYPGQLSGGEQQRVALARAIVHEPHILFADEPTGNLDGKTGAAIVDLLFSLRTRVGATLFLVTHEETLAARCDRILHMKDGLIVAEERPDKGHPQ